MFEAIGTSNARLDDKGRFPLPAAVRKGLKEAGHEHLRVAHWRGHLRVYTESDWRDIELEWAADPSAGGEDLLYGFLATVERVTLDSAGRLRLSASLREWGSIHHEITIITLGAIGVMELWDTGMWSERSIQARVSMQDGPPMDALGIPPRHRRGRKAQREEGQ